MKRLLACLLILTSAAAHAGAPGEAAIGFLNATKDTPGKWEEFTAVFPGTTQEKKLVIAERLNRLSKRLEQGDLRAVEETTDGDLAAVIISQIVDFDPSQITIHAIGLIRRDDDWQPAPVLASFENTGLRYQPGMGAAAARLEKWMLTRRNHHLTRLREDILSDLLTDIQASKTKDELMEDSPSEIVADFMAACRELDTPLALAHLGGLEPKLPEDWRDIVSITSRALHAPWKADGQWQELTDPSLLHVELHTDADATNATVTIGMFNAARSRPGPADWAIRHFSLEKSDAGLWRIRLPLWLLEEESEDANTHFVPTDYENFPGRLIDSHERKAFDTPIALADEFLTSLTGDDYAAVFPCLSRAVDVEESTQLLSETSRLWRSFRPGTQRPVRLDTHRVGDQAWVIYCGFDPKRPEIPGATLHHLILKKDETGWAIVSTIIPGDDPDLPAALLDWGHEAQARDTDAWLAGMDFGPRLGGLADAPAPSEDEARAITKTWTEALDDTDLRKIFPTITGFDDDTAIRRVFAFLGQELPTPTHYEVLGIHRHGRWAGATIVHRTDEDGDDPVEHRLLHPIVVTSNGPRILPEAILYHATSRAQRFINDSVWKRLRARLPEPAVEELDTLYQKHNKLCESLTVTQ